MTNLNTLKQLNNWRIKTWNFVLTSVVKIENFPLISGWNIVNRNNWELKHSLYIGVNIKIEKTDNIVLISLKNTTSINIRNLWSPITTEVT